MKQTVYQTRVASVPESFFAACEMEAVAEGATDYRTAFYDVSDAYTGSAENMAKCNTRYAEGVKQMRELRERYETKQTK